MTLCSSSEQDSSTAGRFAQISMKDIIKIIRRKMPLCCDKYHVTGRQRSAPSHAVSAASIMADAGVDLVRPRGDAPVHVVDIGPALPAQPASPVRCVCRGGKRLRSRPLGSAPLSGRPSTAHWARRLTWDIYHVGIAMAARCSSYGFRARPAKQTYSLAVCLRLTSCTRNLRCAKGIRHTYILKSGIAPRLSRVWRR